ncbi:MAG: hypothetical protein DHS20C15_34030 [Planctomycetota bacterium]|nr:MAG: hypothetical protein DHS20C15_34030 [Planctomycetota bacterium]
MTTRPILTAALALTLLLPAGIAREDGFVASGIVETQGDNVLALRDVDGDGDLDLLVIDELGVSLRRLSAEGSYPREADDVLLWPARDLGWELADLDGRPGTEVVIFADGALRSWAMSAEGFAEPRELLRDKSARIPRGLRRLRLARDVDADGHMDVVLPGVSQYRIHRAGGEGFEAPLRVDFEATVELRVGEPATLDQRFTQAMSIPRLRVRDFDGDGLNDLVSETDEMLSVHVSDPEIPTEATWALDLQALRDELPKTLDLENLLGAIQLVNWSTADLDGSGAHDFVLQHGGTFRVWRDGTRRGIDGPPDSVLKSSGNVLFFLLRDVLGSELPELQIVRGEEISVARVLHWVVAGGALEFDIYTYANEAGELGRKPARSSHVRFEIPPLFSFLEEVDKIQEESRAKAHIQAQRVALDADGLRNDVVDLVGGELFFFHDVVDAEAEESLMDQLSSFDLTELLERYFLADIDSLADDGTYTLDLAEELRQIEFTPAAALQAAAHKVAPTLVLPSPVPGEGRLLVIDLDNDGLTDVIVTGETSNGTPLVGVLVARH